MNRIVTVGILIAFDAALAACAPAPISVRLQPEQPATLHVGDIALVEMMRPYSITGSAGDALVLAEKRNDRSTTVFVYHAVRAGDQTLVASPDDLQNGQCVSCVTRHYFIKVLE